MTLGRTGERDLACENTAEAADERRRLSTLDLVGLAAGGVVGSGWLLAAGPAFWGLGADAIWGWVAGGALMLLIAAVMVELGIAVPKTGGLIFLPLQAAGPLVATVVAAGLWIVYAANPASEAAAMVRGLAYAYPWLLENGDRLAEAGGLGGSVARPYDLSNSGLLCAVAFLALIMAVNLLPQRRLIRLNLVVTVVKVLIPVLIVVCLWRYALDTAHSCVPKDVWYLSGQEDTRAALQERAGHPEPQDFLYMVLGGSIIYAYIGFQAPLDFAGNVKRRGRGEAARLRWAVYGTLVGAFVLYTALQWIFGGLCGELTGNMLASPYAQFATALGGMWLVWLIRLNAVLSPMGSGIVFTHALTREVAALSRAHLTHRGLQTARRASFRFRGAEIDAFWMILLVNFTIGLVMLLLVKGSWEDLVALNSVPALVVYAMPGVVLVALKPPGFPGARRVLHLVLSSTAFVAIAVVIHEAGWGKVWRGMAAVAVGSALLLGLPLLARLDLPFLGRLLRRYDARDHVSRFARPDDPAVRPVLLFLTHLAVLVLCTGLRDALDEHFPGVGVVTLPVAALSAAVLFPLLVTACRRYMAAVPPTLPGPRREAEPAPRATVTAGT
ncbi:APC family permease [Streptomyces ossamyceticus]|uniref:APC family permease n=1 Tax=Streptomyces ossamyceticus TaxID=249581 RepID=A0ABV2UUB1_9ACTN